MRTPILPAVLFILSSSPWLAAQEPVLVAGGSAAPTPVVAQSAQPAASPVTVVYQQPVVYVPVVAGRVCSAPNVIYFGGPNSCYYGGYPGGYYRPGCAYNPSVIYFGRGEACQRGYAFRHPR